MVRTVNLFSVVIWFSFSPCVIIATLVSTLVAVITSMLLGPSRFHFVCLYRRRHPGISNIWNLVLPQLMLAVNKKITQPVDLAKPLIAHVKKHYPAELPKYSPHFEALNSLRTVWFQTNLASFRLLW